LQAIWLNGESAHARALISLLILSGVSHPITGALPVTSTSAYD
jgi:hypothetical protein